MKEIWTFNNYKFISEDEYMNNWDEVVENNISVLKLVDRIWNRVKTNTKTYREDIVAEYIEFSLKLYFFENVKKTKKGNTKYNSYNAAEIFFTPNIRLRRDLVGRKQLLKSYTAKLNKRNPEKPGFYNFNLGFIKNYLQLLNNKLLNKENLRMRDGIKNMDKIKSLKARTLYAPNWMLKKYDPMKIALKKIIEPEELFDKYDFKYQILSNEEMNSKILNGDEFYYLMHTQFNNVKILSIINSLTGEIIYLQEEKSYNVKDSDMKKINNLVK